MSLGRYFVVAAIMVNHAFGKTFTNVTDWTRAPNCYIYTGKDQAGQNTDGLYIPVKKAYDMWEKGGEFMVDEQGKYTPIPAGTATAGLYWEDEIGLIKLVALEGTGKNAKIKVLVNNIKEGNAVISFKVNGIIYWSWHVWVTDDPTDGSTYHHGFEKDQNGNLVTDWKWMDRNLGATNAKLIGHDMFKTKGLQYEWGRKDPFPVSPISGEAGKFTPKQPIPIKFRGNLQPADSSGKLHNTGSDLPNGNVRYSINNPIHYIIAPTYIFKTGEAIVNNGENYMRQHSAGWQIVRYTTWFSKQKLKVHNKDDYYQNVFYDLWGDTRGGKWSNYNTRDTKVADESVRYSLKSPYDPCPCGWRVPSYYSTVSNEQQASPWGRKGSKVASDITNDAPNADYPGIKVYPSYGFDFSGVSNRNLGVIPVNGNYEYYPQPMQMGDGSKVNRNGEKLFLGWYADRNGPSVVYQDCLTDGGLHSSTYNTAWELEGMGTKGFGFVNDAGNFVGHSPIGWYGLSSGGQEGTTYDSSGVRCIKDPNNAYMRSDFETEYVTSPPTTYSPEEVNDWTKDPNCYVAYTKSSQDEVQNKLNVIEIRLRKAYAMHKLYLSANDDFPTGNIKSGSVVWTTDQTLIAKLEIVDGSIDTAMLRVTLNENRFGNAVVAFHLGNTGWTTNGNSDPIVWSWHIWAPMTEIKLHPTFTTETFANGGMRPDPSGQFVNPVHSIYGVPMNTTIMDRDLGAQMPFFDQHFQADYLNFYYNTKWPTSESSLRVLALRRTGGLHYQWGRKDPIPVFYYPGGFYDHSAGGYGTERDNFRRYPVYKQTGLNNEDIVYGKAIDENSYLANYSKEYSTYSSDITVTDSTIDKIKKVLKYSVVNPFTHMYQNRLSTSFDWLSNENGLFVSRWGHGTEKSPFDPCPAGFRIPDLQFGGIDGVNLYDSISGKWYQPYPKGNSPWFYNARFIQNNKTMYGIDPSNYNVYVNNEPYDPNKMNYIGGYVRATGKSAWRYGFVLNRPEYNIGNFANNAVRGFNGGNAIEDWARSGIWTSSATTSNDFGIGMLFNTEITRDAGELKLYYFTPTFTFRPQAAMSCRCAKIEYDEAGKEIGRYDPSKM